jgi:hypothetical protein
LRLQEDLNFWSKQIKADFQNQLKVFKIENVANEPGNQQQLYNMLLDLTNEDRENRKEISETRTTFNAVVLENESHKATISTMANKMNDGMVQANVGHKVTPITSSEGYVAVHFLHTKTLTDESQVVRLHKKPK